MHYSDYKKLNVWRKSMLLAKEVYRLMAFLPENEKFCLCNQMRRAVVSIPSNIAEGNGRNSDREFRRFLEIAQGSRAEIETQLLLCNVLEYLTKEQTSYALSLCDDIRRMLMVFINYLSRSGD